MRGGKSTGCFRESEHRFLDQDEAPKLSRREVINVSAGSSVKGLPADHRRALERILPKVCLKERQLLLATEKFL